MQMLFTRIALFAATLSCSCCQQRFLDRHLRSDVAGYMYTSLNGEGENKVISFARAANGSLLRQTAFATGSNGGANRSALGAFVGNFDSQDSMQIIEDSLLVVNTGGNTISVFDLNRATGDLVLTGSFSSEGTRPVSIAVTAREEKGRYWVVVGNQQGNPLILFAGADGPRIQFFPDEEFVVSGRKKLDPNRNIVLFSFDASTKVLTPVRRIDAYVGTKGGPACVAFSPDGSMLAVVTWGIPHFFAPPGPFQQPSRVYVYDFSVRTGRTYRRRFFEEQGVAGSTGFNWSPVPGQDLLYVSNPVIPSSDLSVTVLDASPRRWRYGYGGRRIPKVQAFATGPMEGVVADCWTHVSQDGRFLWVTGTGPNIVSTFQINPYSGRLSILGPGPRTVFVARPNSPPADTKDLWQSPDGEYLYSLGSLESFQVAQFEIGGTGLSFVTQTVVQATQPLSGERGAFNFQGLVGFDLSAR